MIGRILRSGREFLFRSIARQRIIHTRCYGIKPYKSFFTGQVFGLRQASSRVVMPRLQGVLKRVVQLLAKRATTVSRPLRFLFRYRNPHTLRCPYFVDPIAIRNSNPLAAMSYQLHEREKKTKELIKIIQQSITVEYPKSLSFMLPENKGRILADYTLGNFIAKGSFGAVFNAKLKEDENEPSLNLSPEFDKNCQLVIKQMFNYIAVTNESIFRQFGDEVVFNKDLLYKRYLIHPFILPAERSFIAPAIDHPSCKTEFPVSSPNDAGQERTMYIILQKVDTTLDKFLHQENEDSLKKRFLMCAQLYEAVSHLRKNNMAHRDIKPDNVFIKYDNDTTIEDSTPRVFLGDFGCSIDKLQFMNEPSEQRQGNMAYMPPEIITCGKGKKLDYTSADKWSMTLVVLDILFGKLATGNPFYPRRKGKRYCDPKDYEDDDIWYYFSQHTPSVLSENYKELMKMLYLLISRNPDKRPRLRCVLNEIYFQAFNAPKFGQNSFQNYDVFDEWIVKLYFELHSKTETTRELIKCFLMNLKYDDIKGVFQQAIFIANMLK